MRRNCCQSQPASQAGRQIESANELEALGVGARSHDQKTQKKITKKKKQNKKEGSPRYIQKEKL